MTTAQHEHQPPAAYPAHYEPPHSPTWRFFFGPGFGRALWMTPLFFLLGMYLVVGLRWWWNWDPAYDWTIIVLVGAMVTAPIGFLSGHAGDDYRGRKWRLFSQQISRKLWTKVGVGDLPPPVKE